MNEWDKIIELGLNAGKEGPTSPNGDVPARLWWRRELSDKVQPSKASAKAKQRKGR